LVLVCKANRQRTLSSASKGERQQHEHGERRVARHGCYGEYEFLQRDKKSMRGRLQKYNLVMQAGGRLYLGRKGAK
jgi:hypothetical protein